MKSEKYARPVFYGAMITEGIVALIWAAAAMGVYNLGLQEVNASLATGTVGIICRDPLGPVGGIIALLGGRENIVLVDACMTRLRVTVKDPAKVADLAAWKAEGALSLLVKGDGIQAVYGPKADVLKSDINDIL